MTNLCYKILIKLLSSISYSKYKEDKLELCRIFYKVEFIKYSNNGRAWI